MKFKAWRCKERGYLLCIADVAWSERTIEERKKILRDHRASENVGEFDIGMRGNDAAALAESFTMVSIDL